MNRKLEMLLESVSCSRDYIPKREREREREERERERKKEGGR